MKFKKPLFLALSRLFINNSIIDLGKKSKKGRLKLVLEDGVYILQTVFENGVISKEIDFEGVSRNGLL